MAKIAVTDYFSELEIEREILGDLVGFDVSSNTEILLVWHENINKDYIEYLPKLRGIQRYGVGYDTLDLNYLKGRNIICCNNPDYGVDEVSDTAIAMIMCFSRGILKYDFNSKSYTNNWQENIDPSLKRSSDTFIGVIGAGRIGGSVLLKAKALGFKTLFYDPYQSRGFEKLLGVQRVDNLEELLSISDIITLHCPLNEETRGIINSQTISKVKKGCSLINTARGGLIEDNKIIYNALLENKLSNCGLDVLVDEPPKDSDILINAWKNNDLRFAGRLIITPHTSYFSQQSIIELRKNAALNALRLFNKETPFNIL